ncbi:MAG: AAA family ATPase [Candidatus Heimdallarchaeaceae archaeon]
MLYQTVRPSSFDEMIGNVSVIASLKRLVKREDRPHTYLFSGPTGCGKTTLARIVSKEVGCRERSIIELNAANSRGIDTSREVAATASLSSIYGGSKAYIFDECHQLTKPAMQALLKVIEDTPSNCYFFFCTTDPGSLIPTLRNRCTEFQVHSLNVEEMFELLVDIVVCQEMKVEDEILVLISETCDGCPRKALVSLEKVKDIKDPDKAIDLITEESNRSSSILDLYKSLVTIPSLRMKKRKKIFEILENIEDDPESIRIALLKLFLKYLNRCDDETTAKDIAKLIKIFSQNVYYGGRAQLGVLIVQAIFGV